MLLARHEEINQWLSEHPLILGGLFLMIGLLLLGYGMKDIVTRQSRGKWGTKFQGETAVIVGLVRALGGVGSILFGVYKIIEGLF